MKLQHPFLTLSWLVASAGVSLAQANDECAMATPVGPGGVAFDTGAATLSAEPWNCALGGGPDLWYAYTATTATALTVSTCGSSYDTALEIFSGTCAALVLEACNDDTCGLQSSVQVMALAGATYYVRVGGFNGLFGAGTLLVNDGTPVLNPVNGNYYAAIASPGITWDQARADAAMMSYQGVSGRLATLNDAQENDFVFALGDVNYHWLGGFQNTASPNYAEPDGGWEWITGEPFTYANWFPGEPNNTGGFGAEDYLELLQGLGFGESWNDAAQMEHPRGYIVEFPGGALGMSYCMANANSTGAAAQIAAAGSATASSNDLTLTTSEMPSFSFGFFIASQSQGFVANPNGSQGNLCLGGAIGRYVGPGQIQNSGAMGELVLALNLNQTPTPTGLVAVLPGQTWNFSTWFRDTAGGAPTSNFSNGVSVPFN